NTPVNLPYVLQSLAENLNMPEPDLAELLWKNSLTALKLS
ncbi:TatD family deoxyribonuclease, partial [Acinetobacter baumannii]